MLDQLRELAEAEPFKPFTVRLSTGTELEVAKAKDIQFTHYGNPKINAATVDSLGRMRWTILNVDTISEIIL